MMQPMDVTCALVLCTQKVNLSHAKLFYAQKFLFEHNFLSKQKTSFILILIDTNIMTLKMLIWKKYLSIFTVISFK